MIMLFYQWYKLTYNIFLWGTRNIVIFYIPLISILLKTLNIDINISTPADLRLKTLNIDIDG